MKKVSAILALIAIFNFNANSMEQNNFENLPRELKIEIIRAINADTLEEAFAEIGDILLINKYFYNLINDPKNIGLIMLELSKNFNTNILEIISKYNQTSGYIWLENNLSKLNIDQKLLSSYLSKAIDKDNKRMARIIVKNISDQELLREALKHAIKDKNAPIVSAIIKKALDLNKTNFILHDLVGYGLLYQFDFKKILSSLLADPRIDVNVFEEGFAAGRISIFNLALRINFMVLEPGKRNLEIFEILLNDPKIDINLKNKSGQTPTAYAINLFEMYPYDIDLEKILDMLKAKGGHE